ncbi:Lin1244/Lin1753 domain-containing protein [Orenia marismortui]|uniref:DnaD/phage-associated family protein n=1 Tax=Orenia marismortui TaxID=46469 RepID=A0A4V3GYE2_9FIRM|nr:Lin1244/Lin1753 domain-containing protein [Orenia marismortui]TDX52160.1 DnaD/phage-associated family protein [Orenia marismortui]
MARPKKSCLDYFSLDVTMDDETNLIIAQYGMEGYGILISMFQRIYGYKGYYHKWTEREQILFSSRVSVSKNKVVDVINDCIKWGIFDQEKYSEHQILTSKRVQEHYIDVTYRRAEVEIELDYLVIDKVDRDNIVYTGVSDSKNSPSDKVSDNKSTQSKVSSKVISKVKDEEEDTHTHEEEEISQKKKDPVFDMYEKVFGRCLSAYQVELLDSYTEDGLTDEIIIMAIEEGGKRDVNGFKWIQTTLNDWLSKELDEPWKVKRYLKERNGPKKGDGVNEKHSSNNSRGFQKGNQHKSEYGKGCLEDPELQEVDVSIDDL